MAASSDEDGRAVVAVTCGGHFMGRFVSAVGGFALQSEAASPTKHDANGSDDFHAPWAL